MSITITCHCGAARQRLSIQTTTDTETVAVSLCGCSTCRHVTGVLGASYLPISSRPSLTGLTPYSSSTEATRYFCSTCGCHVFRLTTLGGLSGSIQGAPRAARISARDDHQQSRWEVATGAIVGPYEQQSLGVSKTTWSQFQITNIRNVFIAGAGTEATKCEPGFDADVDTKGGQSIDDSNLPASCHCGRISLQITRPDASSTLASSPFSDLILPYCRTPSATLANPGNEKWWLRSGSRYLAGTCACQSCRLISGFEIQTWAFVPRANIHIQLPFTPSASHQQPTFRGLDFENLPHGILRSYPSSTGVLREFCPRCGATIFWHDSTRPTLIDLSVGLLRNAGSAHAEDWLDWWTERVSFEEESRTGRTGFAADMAEILVRQLEDELRNSGTSISSLSD